MHRVAAHGPGCFVQYFKCVCVISLSQSGWCESIFVSFLLRLHFLGYIWRTYEHDCYWLHYSTIGKKEREKTYSLPVIVHVQSSKHGHKCKIICNNIYKRLWLRKWKACRFKLCDVILQLSSWISVNDLRCRHYIVTISVLGWFVYS